MGRDWRDTERTLEGGDFFPVRREPISGVQVSRESQSRALKRVESQVAERQEAARIPEVLSEQLASEVSLSQFLVQFSAHCVEDFIVIGEYYHNLKNVLQLAIVLCYPINRFK
jgi:hypothetical protein